MNTNLFANPQLFNAYQSDPKLAMAQGLLQQGASTAPVRSPLEGLARALTGGLGGYQASQVRGAYQQQDQSYRKGLAAALQGDDVVSALSNSSDPTLQGIGLEQQLALGQARAKAKIDLANTLAGKGLAQGADGSVQPVPGFGAAEGQNANAQAMGTIPSAVAQQQAMIPGAVDQATRIAIQNAQVDLQKAVAMGPIAAQNEVAKIKATMPLVVQQAVLTAQGTGPVQTQTAANTAAATAPIQTAQAVSQATALSPIQTQTAANTAKATRLPDITTMINPTGTSSVSLDKTTPEGQAQLRDLMSKGYVERPGGVTINMNEDQAKAAQLYTRSQQQLRIATDNWGELAKLANQAGAKVPLGGNFMVSDKYQQASAAVKDIAASYLYSVSGATANPGEVANLVDTIVPKPGDSTATVKEKKQRLTDMVNSIQLRMKPGMAVPSLPAASPDATSPIPPPPPGFQIVPAP